VAAREHANRPALREGNLEWSYTELSEAAEAYAARLRQLGVKRGDFVVLCLERTRELIAGLLGILRCGAAYVPLEVDIPASRLEVAVADTGARAAIAQGEAAAFLEARGVAVVRSRPAPGSAPAAEASPAGPGDPAYVIYTSGSTGKPKGVLVTNDNVLALFRGSAEHFTFAPSDVWTLFHSISFDFSVWEVFGPLLSGGSLVIVPRDIARSTDAFAGLLKREGVTVLNQTPSAFRALVELASQREEHFPSLRTIVLGGEAAEGHVLARWFQRAGDEQPQLINMYGITETTVHVTFRRIRLRDVTGAWNNPIGHPLPHLEVQLRTPDGKPIPPSAVGEAGEIFVLGEGVAGGYLQRPELTRERFVLLEDGRRAYRSGDLARWLENGELGYLGRGDDQVKIRGYRIELGEIASVLAEDPSVREAVVVPHALASGDVQLVTFYVPAAPLDSERLRALAAQRLPAYMHPARYIAVEQVPLTSNGKADKKALLALLRQEPVPEQPAPGGDEAKLRALWAELLGHPSSAISPEANFFSLGGHSLQLLSLATGISREFGVEVGMPELFEASRLDAQLTLIRRTPAAAQSFAYAYELDIDGALATFHVTREQFEREGAPPGALNVRAVSGEMNP
jgi:amino acid adenylation domain-containing protein